MTAHLRPLLARERYSDEEWELATSGRCSEQVSESGWHTQPCGQPSDPGSPYRACTDHDRQIREDYPDSWHRDDQATR